jgi:hypothetical protein
MCSSNRDIAAARLKQCSDNNSVTLEVIEFRLVLWKIAGGVLLAIKISAQPVEIFVEGRRQG